MTKSAFAHYFKVVRSLLIYRDLLINFFFLSKNFKKTFSY